MSAGSILSSTRECRRIKELINQLRTLGMYVKAFLGVIITLGVFQRHWLLCSFLGNVSVLCLWNSPRVITYLFYYLYYSLFSDNLFELKFLFVYHRVGKCVRNRPRVLQSGPCPSGHRRSWVLPDREDRPNLPRPRLCRSSNWWRPSKSRLVQYCRRWAHYLFCLVVIS